MLIDKCDWKPLRSSIFDCKITNYILLDFLMDTSQLN